MRTTQTAQREPSTGTAAKSPTPENDPPTQENSAAHRGMPRRSVALVGHERRSTGEPRNGEGIGNGVAMRGCDK
jgi:hypothetical protein